MNKKKLLALLMALVMTFTLVPVTAFAEEVVAFDASGATWEFFVSASDYREEITQLDNIGVGNIVANGTR